MRHPRKKPPVRKEIPRQDEQWKADKNGKREKKEK